MSLTLQQLTAALSKEDLREQALNALRGIGYIKHDAGFGPGQVLVSSGAALGTFEIKIQIATSGEPGVATYLLSTNGGQTYGVPQLMPAVQTTPVVLGATGVSVLFQSGPVGSYTVDRPSFQAGDTYAFSLSVPNFPTMSWQPGEVPLALVDVFSDGSADAAQTVQQAIEGGFIYDSDGTPLSSGAWLDVLMRFYNLTRRGAVVTKGRVTITDTAGVGPFSLAGASVVIQTAGGLLYTGAQNVTVPHLGSVQMLVQANQPGAAYNVGNGTLTQFVTSLPGLAVTNPDPGTGTWITQQGADTEQDQVARTRCLSRWPSLAPADNKPSDAYLGFAMEADPSVTRVASFPDGTSPGQVDVIIAGPAGALAGGIVAAVQAFMAPLVGLCATLQVSSASNHAITVSGDVYIKAAYFAQAPGIIGTNLAALFGNGIVVFNIDGSRSTFKFDIGGLVVVAEIVAVIEETAGVTNLVLTSPLANVQLGAAEVATLTLSLAYHSV